MRPPTLKQERNLEEKALQFKDTKQQEPSQSQLWGKVTPALMPISALARGTSSSHSTGCFGFLSKNNYKCIGQVAPKPSILTSL